MWMEVGLAPAGSTSSAWGTRKSPPQPDPKPVLLADFAGPIEPVEGIEAALIRTFDLLAAVAGLLVLAPVMLIIAFLVRLDGHGSSLFVHERIGRYGVPFPCLKFRTMVSDADLRLAEHLAASPEARIEWERDYKLRDDPRTTFIGRFLRKYSLDELPQLFNIVIGHMGVVGPRPIIEDEVSNYGVHFAEFCSVRPGLTGLWQISGRNNISYDKRVALDCRYIATKSLRGDIMIFLRTVPALIRPVGSY